MATSALFSVLRDVAKLASSAADDVSSQATSLATAADDVAVLTGKAAAKTAGLAGDDLAVGVGQVEGVAAARELPVVWRIARASFLNKVWLSGLLMLVSYLYPPAITAALVAGGLYLAYEGAHGLLEMFWPHEAQDGKPVQSEDQKVRGAVRTDLVLSLEILVIALSAIGEVPMAYKAGVLLAVSVLMTTGVYGLIALLLRLDDMGLALVRKGPGLGKRVGGLLIKAAPAILRALEPIGVVAMFAVAGGIFTHLAHVSHPHWALALVTDVGIGLVGGLTLLGATGLLARMRAWLR